MRSFMIALTLATGMATAASGFAQTAEIDRDRYEARKSGDQARSDLRRYVDRRRAYRDARYGAPRPVLREEYTAYAPPAPSWRYRSVTVGRAIDQAYYAPRYQIDARRYGLESSAGSVRWIRYGDDVVRVNTATGRVLAVRRSYFRP